MITIGEDSWRCKKGEPRPFQNQWKYNKMKGCARGIPPSRNERKVENVQELHNWKACDERKWYGKVCNVQNDKCELIVWNI